MLNMKILTPIVVLLVALLPTATSGIFSSEEDDLYESGWKHQLDGDMALAFADYALAARRGHAKAMGTVGAWYYNGIPGACEKNYEKAFYWTSKAAEAGRLISYVSLGDYYYKGVGVKKDRSKALELWSFAAGKKIPCAIEKLAKMRAEKKKAYGDYNFSDSVEEALKKSKDKNLRTLKDEVAGVTYLITQTEILGITFDCGLCFSEDKLDRVLISISGTSKEPVQAEEEYAVLKKALTNKQGSPSDISEFEGLGRLFPYLGHAIFWEGDYQLFVLGVCKDDGTPQVNIIPLLSAIPDKSDSTQAEPMGGF